MKIVFELLLIAVFVCWAVFFADSNLQPELFGMAIGASGSLFLQLCYFIIDEWIFFRLYWDTWKPFQNPQLRLTIAYLYNIEDKGRYLLVKSNRLVNTYQPVGGVYKYFHPEATTDLNVLGAIPDNAIANDDVSENDLRLKLRNRKKLRSFLNWFLSGKEREFDPWREFYEELVASGILPEVEFRYIHYELIGQHFEPIHYDAHFKVDTFKYVDIYRPKFVTENQKKAISALRAVNSIEYIWATEDEIMNKVTQDGKRIADHTYKIFHTKRLKR